jgi:hypothetical protein
MKGFTGVICAAAFIVLALNRCAAQKIDVTVDGSSTGRLFEGIGALSAGASSRLLADYPEPQRSDILDVLFKPYFAASLHHLKIEIGGDINSTDGTEPSHARTRQEFLRPQKEYFNRGYEWMLMKEARSRNQAIILDVLQWGAPAWIGDHEPGSIEAAVKRFYSRDNAEYIASFINGASTFHKLKIDYCGIWNETPYDISWIKMLRRTLDETNLRNVRIVAADQTPDVAPEWKIAEEILTDAELANAVHTIGAHYVSSTGWKFALKEPFASTVEAKKTGKPLWASEDGPWRGDWEGARSLAKMFNRNYVIGRLSKTIIWSLITSYYDNLPIAGSGPMKANTPWSGSYEIQPAIWAIAHTTQFAQPGWRYLDNACGVLPEGGSYVTLRDPSSNGWSMIVETMDAKARQFMNVHLKSPLFMNGLTVWRTDEQHSFEKQNVAEPTQGTFAIELEPNSIYSWTTASGQKKGTPVHLVPNPADFPSSYSEDFETAPIGATPKYFSDLFGAFEVSKVPGVHGHVLQQIIPGPGIEWPLVAHRAPRTIIGSRGWKDYQVSCDVLLNEKGWAEVGARFDKPWDSGYWLQVHFDGRWKVCVNGTVLSEGKVASSDPPNWRRLTVRCDRDQVSFSVNGVRLTTMQDTTYKSGLAGIGTGWNEAYFDNFEVAPITK